MTMLHVALLGEPPFVQPTSYHGSQGLLQNHLSEWEAEKVDVQAQCYVSIFGVRLPGFAHPLILFFLVIAFGGLWMQVTH